MRCLTAMLLPCSRMTSSARCQHVLHRPLLVRRKPQPVGGLDVDLPRDELAAKRLVGRQPCGRIAKCLVEVGLSADGQQVARVVGEVAATLVVPFARTFVPGVRKRNQVVDLHDVRRGRSSGERDRLARVRVVEHAALRVAGAGSHDEIGEVSAQDVVAGVAAVVAELDVHVVAPRLTEPVAGEVGDAVPALDRQPVQRRARRVEGRIARWADSGLRCRRPSRRRRRPCLRARSGSAARSPLRFRARTGQAARE